LCELARVDPAYQTHVVKLSAGPLDEPATVPPPADPDLGSEADALARVFACPHRDHCGCSRVECAKKNQRVTLVDCLACVESGANG